MVWCRNYSLRTVNVSLSFGVYFVTVETFGTDARGNTLVQWLDECIEVQIRLIVSNSKHGKANCVGLVVQYLICCLTDYFNVPIIYLFFPHVLRTFSKRSYGFSILKLSDTCFQGQSFVFSVE